jgi:hypothetical protein
VSPDRDLPVSRSGVLLPRAHHQPRRPEGPARAHAGRLVQRLHAGDRGAAGRDRLPEVYSALERGVVDCAITGTATGNGARWYEVTRHMYALPVQWGSAAYVANLAWWNKLDPAVRDFIQATFKDVEDQQWALGAEATEDGIACNSGKREGCKIGHVVENRPMTVTRPTDADMETLRASLRRPCSRPGSSAAAIAVRTPTTGSSRPITGIKYEPR